MSTVIIFLYEDHIGEINPDTVIDLYKVSHKYMIAPLKTVCVDKINSFTAMENIGEILEMVLVL